MLVTHVHAIPNLPFQETFSMIQGGIINESREPNFNLDKRKRQSLFLLLEVDKNAAEVTFATQRHCTCTTNCTSCWTHLPTASTSTSTRSAHPTQESMQSPVFVLENSTRAAADWNIQYCPSFCTCPVLFLFSCECETGLSQKEKRVFL